MLKLGFEDIGKIIKVRGTPVRGMLISFTSSSVWLMTRHAMRPIEFSRKKIEYARKTFH